MEIDFFGIKIGSGGESKEYTTVEKTYILKREQLLDKLGIKGKATFIKYDATNNTIRITVEEQDGNI